MADISSSSLPASDAAPAASPEPSTVPSARWQAAVGGGVFLVAVGLAVGALQIPGDAGYGGVGPNFLPWVCAAVLGVCGAWLVWEALTGGYRQAGEPGGAAKADLGPFVWVSAGLLLNALLITHLGFILSCTLCYALAVQGLRRAAGQSGLLRPRTLATDGFTGLVISAPVFWVFTQFLAINLPGLTETGWL